MFIRSISPTGALSTLNLSVLPIYRLKLVANKPADLGIGIQYVAQGKIATIMAAALDCLSQDHLHDAEEVARVGFPKDGPAANKERLQEAMKIFYQSEGLKEAAASELIAKSVGLVDIYYAIINALSTGADTGGYYEGWKWIVSREESGWKIPGKPTQPV